MSRPLALRALLTRVSPAALLLVLFLMWGGSLLAQDTPPPSAPPDSTPTPAPLPTRSPRPSPSINVDQDGLRLGLYFQGIAQGSTRLIRVAPIEGAAVAPIQSARARFLNNWIDLFPASDGFYGLLAADMEQPTTQSTTLQVYATLEDGSRVVLEASFPIILGGFIRQTVTIAPDRAYLVDIETERAELATLESAFSVISETKHWDSGGFIMPIRAALTAPFGAFRTFNDGINTRHTGWDIRAGLGTPVVASAAGRVAFAGRLPIRGNHVIVDHGYGVFSTYSHLAITYVTTGQLIAREQLVGTVGDTGRTSGPHFHWEVAVNGRFVDPVQFLQMWTP